MGHEFVHNIHSRDIRSAGVNMSVHPSVDDCGELARQLGVVAVSNVTADFLVKPERRFGYRLTGQISADIRQSCVVTGDPIDSRVDELVDILFLPPAEADRQAELASAEKETTFSANEDDIEALDKDSIDLAKVIAEFLAIGLDPYPRAPGVAIGDHIEDNGDGDDKPPSPFDTLKGLVDEAKDQ